jgi:hypothetical protein
MKVEDKVLQDILRAALSDGNRRSKSFKDKFKINMNNKYNIKPGDSMSILNGTTPVEIMSRDIMFKTTKVLWELNKTLSDGYSLEKLDTDKYFTEREIEEFGKKIDLSKEDKDIVISQWLQVEEDQYVTVISIDEIVRLINQNKIRYNPETQRKLTLKETKNGIEKYITLYPKALDEIEEAMVSNNYISNALTFNINPDYYEPPRIINGNLIIPKASIMDCIDGFHRLKVANLVKMKNSNWNKNLIINLMVYDRDKAVKYILQEDKKNHLTAEQVVEQDQLDAANFIIKKLDESDNFYFRNTLEDKKILLNKLIHTIFKPKRLISLEQRQEAGRMFKFIEKNLNSLIESEDLYEKKFDKSDWFIYLFVLGYCFDKKKQFVDIITKLPMEVLQQEIKFNTQPLQKHFSLMNEVIDHV